ncbi:MAG: glutamyl-tRNA reductase, partial [Sulfolobales archaeon]|nr:glutamyl-tRNA reductase [Sulfolobales archaeon]
MSYKTIGLKELEHYSLRYDAFKMISNLIPLELYLLQTCNRVEVYAFGSEEDFKALLNLLNDLHGKGVVHKGTVLKGREVVRHAFEVASGLDSLAIGEYEILRQMKEALESSK